jgi:hypothetical protein
MSLKTGLIERFRKAMPTIKELIKDLEWIEDGFDPSQATEEERSIVKHLAALSHHRFDDAAWRLEELFAPDVIVQGRLVKNSLGRYEIEGTDRYFTCGGSCEAYLPFRDCEDEEDKLMTWVPTSIEGVPNGNYYFTASPGVPLDGVLVRVRGYKK